MTTEKKLPKRKDVPQAYKWHIEDFYETEALWQEDKTALQQELPALSALENHFGQDAASFFHALDTIVASNQKLDKIYTYAQMKLHEDSGNAASQSMSAQADSLLIAYSTATAFLSPAILSLPEDTISAFCKEFPEKAKLYQHFLENLLRQKSHSLSAAEEKLLAQAGELGGAPQQIFTMLNEADLTFPAILDEAGNVHELTKGRYISYLESNDRTLRANAFHALYDAYGRQKNTLAAIYSASVKSDVFFAKARNYASAMEMALADDHIPLSVYDTLIETVHAHLPLMHKYVSLRKKLLGVDELHMYDLYAPLVPDAQCHISFAEAKATVLKALSVMGKTYTDALEKGMESGWIDIYENEGKRSGAYSWGSFSVHPFVLLNHNDTLNSMFTLAHEMGHAMHSYFTWKSQPFLYADHKIFVAEVASTCNEALLMEYLRNHTQDENYRRYLINYFMEQFRGTLFRQTMFAEFEKITHEMAERGEALAQEGMNQIYHDLNRRYFGDDIVIDADIDLEWARIPHFYNAFYVYQYATGYSAAIALSQRILSEGAPAVADYLDFLSKGSSKYSIDLLKGAGVDMSQKAPIENALAVFAELLDEMESWTK